jgi:two-component system alkaline phosphatase synthesis response regulator PhoP
LTGCCPANQDQKFAANIREKGFDKLVIMMTAKAQDVDKIEAYNFGVSDYITKPL